MHWGSFLVMLALLVGAGPALAQINAPSVAPYPVEPAAKQKPKHAVGKHTVPKTEAKAEHKARPRAVAEPAAAAKQTVTRSANTSLPKSAKAEPAKAAKPDATKPSFAPGALAGISAADRMKIQQELYWSGDYTGSTGGDDPLEAAVRKFQKRNKSKITGALTDAQRAELVAAAERHSHEFGWRVVVDPATGVRIGLPTKLVPDVHDAAHGTRWSSPHGEVQVETFRIKNAKLATLFEQEKKKPRRTIEHSVLNDDNFFLSGMQGLKYYSVRAKQRDGEVRGFTLLYDQMMEGIVAPVMVAMASAFSPFPEHAAPFAALEKKVEYGTGLIVGARGDIVTARKVADGCQVIVADGLGNAEHVAEDGEHGLALLRIYGAGKLPALALPHAAPKAGDITLIGIPDPKEQDGAKKLTEIKARLADGAAIELRQPVPMAGFAGAAALGAQGQFIGMMETRNFVLASADPGLPPVRLVTAGTILRFLAKNHVTADGTSGDAHKAAIRIICIRK